MTRRRKIVLAVVAVLAVVVVVLGRKWKQNSDRGGQLYAEPFRIAGNLYYVGANDVAAFLVTGPEGHVLIDGGYPGTPPLILASIAKLGASEWSAESIESGGDDPDIVLALRPFFWSGLLGYPKARVDRRLKDGDTVRVGPIALVANVTGGHTRGCTSWSFRVRDGDRDLDVVSACSLVTLGVQLATPREMGGEGGAGANLEQLFAAACAACFLSARQPGAGRAKTPMAAETSLDARQRRREADGRVRQAGGTGAREPAR